MICQVSSVLWKALPATTAGCAGSTKFCLSARLVHAYLTWLMRSDPRVPWDVPSCCQLLAHPCSAGLCPARLAAATEAVISVSQSMHSR